MALFILKPTVYDRTVETFPTIKFLSSFKNSSKVKIKLSKTQQFKENINSQLTNI